MPAAVVFIGAPGAGKSTIAAAVAGRLGRPHIDTDDLVEHWLGQSVAEIFVELGEPIFRVAENEAVVQALAADDAVVSLGGGAVMDVTSQMLLAGHRVVWLRVSLAEAATRAGMNQSRPLLLQNPRATLAKLLDERTPVYRSLAELTIDTDAVTVEDAADEVVRWLNR